MIERSSSKSKILKLQIRKTTFLLYLITLFIRLDFCSGGKLQKHAQQKSVRNLDL